MPDNRLDRTTADCVQPVGHMHDLPNGSQPFGVSVRTRNSAMRCSVCIRYPGYVCAWPLGVNVCEVSANRLWNRLVFSRSREAAEECSPRRKPREKCGQRQAPAERKISSHAQSLGFQAETAIV